MKTVSSVFHFPFIAVVTAAVFMTSLPAHADDTIFQPDNNASQVIAIPTNPDQPTDAQPARVSDSDSGPRIESGVIISGSQLVRPGQYLLSGIVYLTNRGVIKVKWKGVTISGGHLAVGDVNGGDIHNKPYVAVNVPSLNIDLQDIFGKYWMDDIGLTVSPFSYVKDPAEGQTEMYVGKVMINLSQVFVQTDDTLWRLSESAGAAAYGQTDYQYGGQNVKALPIYFNVENYLFRQISPSVAWDVSLSAYAVLMRSFVGPNQTRLGATLSSHFKFFKHLDVGARLDGDNLIVYSENQDSGYEAQVSGFLRYLLSKPDANVQHAILVSFGELFNLNLPANYAGQRKGAFIGARYSITF